jgi:large subunit ribosomal protein L9
MKVILLKDIEKLGKKLEVKEVKDGYARNFLIPNNLVKPLTKESLQWLEIQKEIEEKKAEEGLKKIQEVASSLDGLEINFSVKVGEQNQLFESIGQQKVAEKLKEMNFDIKKNQIEMNEPIKEVGDFPIKIKLEHNLEADVKVVVSEGEVNKD